MNSITPNNRRELRASHAKLAAAISEEADCISAVNELRATIEAAQAAESKAVAGLLARKGKQSNESIEASQIIAQGSLARLALPEAEKALEAAQADTERLKREVFEAAKAQLITDARSVMAEYSERIASLCETYDRLVGIKCALLGEAGHRAIEVPLFKLVPYAETAMHRHGASGDLGDPRLSALASQAAWSQALEKLVADPDADIGNLIAA